MTLKDLKPGQSAVIAGVGGEGELRQHFLDMGVIPGTVVTLVKLAPLGDPMELCIQGYELTLRLEDAEKITVADIHPARTDTCCRKGGTDLHDHPGLGEGGRYHVKADAHPLPAGTVISFALVGNQNCGKTTLFNQLTGASQHVGNFPGVTVDRKSGTIRGHADTEVTDLPGIYSLSPYSAEEIVSREFILQDHPDGIINIVDATNIERNLYLTMQLIELDVPMVLALNMMDELTGNGGSVLINRMEDLLGIPVVPISAAKGQGIGELVNHALHVARNQERPGRKDFCQREENGGAVHRAIHGVAHLIADHAERAGIPVRFAATKAIEGDASILEMLQLDENESDMLGHIVQQMEKERGLDRAASIADMRFSFIRSLVEETVVKPRESREARRSAEIDRVLTGRYTGIPAFAAIMALVFFLTFNVIGPFLQDLLQAGIDLAGAAAETVMVSAGVNPVIRSLVMNGFFGGVGSVVSFLPIIVTLFFFLSLLEDTGYMARIAFVMDKLLRRIGLSGRSIVPMLVGFGCSVPAVMSSRTLSSERDRKMTILLTPYFSCSAKLPIYGFFCAAFFGRYAGAVMIGLYAFGIAAAIVMALLMKKTMFRGEAVPFVMELPNYRLPSLRNVAQLLWEKSKDFLQKAFTIIFLATIAVWFLQTFDFSLNAAASSQDSILAHAAGWIAPLFRPLGFGDWRVVSSLLTGFMAKESVVSTLNMLLGPEAITAVLSTGAAAALLVFCLLYTPCVAAVTAVKRELGTGWMFFVIGWQCLAAWAAAFAVRMLLLLIGVF